MPQNPLYQVFSYTAAADTPFALTALNIYMKEIDIFVYTNDAYIGDKTDQALSVSAGDVYTIKGPINISDIFIKNKAAGQNTAVSLAGVTLSYNELKEAGIIL